MDDVFNAVAGVLAAGDRAVLLTIVRANGSTPQRVGAKMLLYDDGRTVGTIGGGCYENDACQKARLALRDGRPQLVRYDLNDDFAEESGLIVPIGEWALHEACRQNHEWSNAGFGPLVVAVNLSPRQFQQQRIEDVTARILRSTGLDPRRLELEVTESLAMHEPNDITATLADLRSMGVQCSIDDFGTGYSGLNHLTGFPIDKLKIDKSFVATIDTDREAPIVVAVVALAHGLGLEVVAEGVETTEQLERLRELGCDEMQGFLFSRPLPPAEFQRLLETGWSAPPPFRSVVRDLDRGGLTIAG